MPTYEDEVKQQAGLHQERARVMEVAHAATEKALASLPVGSDPTDLVAFVAPVEKNTTFLVKAGVPLTINDPQSPRGKRMYDREGDVYVSFNDGLAVLERGVNDVEIAWCEAHPEVCRSTADPMTDAWAYMKELQHPKANQDAQLPASIDIEAILRGDARGSRVAHQTTERARERIRQE